MMTQTLRMALVQDNPTVGDVQGNLAKALAHIATHKDADLVVFSECFLSGYPLNDLVLRPGFVAQVADTVDALRDAVVDMAGPAVLMGAPLAGTTLPHNAAFLVEPSGTVRTVVKTELPNDDVFDERRTFAPSSKPRPEPLAFRGFRLGVLICEDMWHGPVARSLAEEMADVLLVPNGSPYQGGKQAIRLAHATRRVRDTGLPLVYVNQFGGQDELVFDGASFVMNTDGAVMQGKAFEADVLRVVLRRVDGMVHVEGDTRFERDATPYPSDTTETDYKACVLGLADYMRKIGASRAFIGISGGLDSSLVATMAVDALGAGNVVGVMMPSRYTGEESLGLADDLMARLGIHRGVLPIGGMHDAVSGAIQGFLSSMGASLGVEPALGITDENIQARLRGLSLMAFTNAFGGVVLTTGNKSEMSVGYATLYGDMSGGFNPIKSVYKSDAFKMCAWRNNATGFALSNPIPDGIISRPPTAELAEGQTDAKSLGDYAALDTVLRALIEDRMAVADTARHLEAAFPEGLSALTNGMDAQAYVAKIARLVRISQYKRAQSAPGVKIHATDFGLGWRYPIAGSYTL
jgi:NAD+ synthase